VIHLLDYKCMRCVAADDTEPEATSSNSGTCHSETPTDKVRQTETTDLQHSLGGKLSVLQYINITFLCIRQ